MEPLLLGATEESPGINFDKSLGKFLVFGKSFPEEAKRFFDPIIIWLEEYAQNANDTTKFEFRLEYYSSVSSTMILDIMYILERIVIDEGKKVTVEWNYLEEDDDMLEAGKEYEEIIKIPFIYKIIEAF